MSGLVMYVATKDGKYLAPYEKRNKAWPAVLSKLLLKGTEPIEVKNVAVTASVTAQLTKQVMTVQPSDNPTVAFFLTGHNDLCHFDGTTTALSQKLKGEYEEALRYWDSSHEGATAYLIPVADVYKVYEVLDGYKWFDEGGKTYTCNDSWERLFPYCVSHYRKFQSGTIKEYALPRITAVNHALEDLATKMNRESKKNQFRYVRLDNPIEVEQKIFAMDCYHLSEYGQNYVARKIYQNLVN